MASTCLPPLAPYPETAWQSHISNEAWQSCLDAWLALTQAHLLLSADDFERQSCKDDSVVNFLSSFLAQAATLSSIELRQQREQERLRRLRRNVFFLIARLLESHPSPLLLSWGFLADFCTLYGRGQSTKVIASTWARYQEKIKRSLSSFKTSLISQLELGVKGSPRALESHLRRLAHLLHASPDIAAFFAAGTDFLDGLVSCYKLMDPPLRRAIISTTYLTLIGLTEGEIPSLTLLTDQLYALKNAAEAHKAGPLNARESLVVELVSSTPILRQVEEKIGAMGSSRSTAIVRDLAGYRGPSSAGLKRLVKRKIDRPKGKSKAMEGTEQIHIHRMSLISQVQDLFPDLGAGFITRLLDEYDENVEVVITHLLENSLPSHLDEADRAAPMPAADQVTNDRAPDLAPRSTPPLMSTLPIRKNVFDDDDFDRLAVSTNRVHLGQQNPDRTAEDILADRSNAPAKASILAALAAFDSDDDERDDTYDVEDIGASIDTATPGNNPEENIKREEQETSVHEETLFRAWKANSALFERSPAVRREQQRHALRADTGMTDEAIEGWALMLSRDPRRLRRLEAKFSAFSGQQNLLAPTSWTGNSETEDSDTGGRGGFRGRGRGRGGGGGGGGGRGRGRGNVAGPSGERETEQARRRKEQNKGAAGNHNRKAANAKKMARGGFTG